MSAAWKEPLEPDQPKNQTSQVASSGSNKSPVPIQFYGGYQVYSESGVDLTLLRENLKRSISDRWEKNCQALPAIKAFRNAGLSSKHEHSTIDRSSVLLDIPGILRLLSTHHVDYVVIGGLALISHGSDYVTKDVDICYSRSAKNISALAASCSSIHPYMRGAPPGLPFRFDSPTIQAGLNFTLTTDLGDIDFLGEVSGLGFYDKVLAMSEEKDVYGLKVRVLSLDGLIVAKKAAGRTKDQLHLLELE